MRSSAVLALALSLVPTLALTGCKDRFAESARRAESNIAPDLRAAREGAANLVRNLVPRLESVAATFAQPMANNSEAAVRAELQALSRSGGALETFPTGFIAAIRPDGSVIARDRPEAEDRMRGMAMAPLFSAVREALAGTGTLGSGALPADGTTPARPYIVGAVPVRSENNVVGALVAGIYYGSASVAIDRAVRLRTQGNPILWVGLQYDGRVYPIQRDSLVAQRYWIPESLTREIPRDTDSRLQNATSFTWNFVEGGQRGWAGSIALLADYPGTRIVVYRSEARQE